MVATASVRNHSGSIGGRHLLDASRLWRIHHLAMVATASVRNHSGAIGGGIFEYFWGKSRSLFQRHTLASGGGSGDRSAKT